jgi:hypothetical protein
MTLLEPGEMPTLAQVGTDIHPPVPLRKVELELTPGNL